MILDVISAALTAPLPAPALLRALLAIVIIASAVTAACFTKTHRRPSDHEGFY